MSIIPTLMFSYIRLPRVTVEFRDKFQATATSYVRHFVEEYDHPNSAVSSYNYVVILNFASIKWSTAYGNYPVILNANTP